ncbi:MULTISPECIES: helix-turn-helix domain-containing protein [Niastella]|uniref:Helix-turn-helix domain-containing protein n=1 Tax=Niastella soli TaxID=2821487 RepID=A0ABS3YY27_9BACT|nr:helix-turn-helix domain-containing protein [Niastella soli]MBO9202832.1 helix-turn-helix domain-containing protein [Niastella soli]
MIDPGQAGRLTEFSLLVLLADAGDHLVSKEEILNKVWKGKDSDYHL